MPPGYLVPIRTRTNNTAGSQYPTDVAHIQCECSWVAPTLPPATANVSHIPVSLDSFGITAIQTVPHGLASKSFNAPTLCCVSLIHPHSIRSAFKYDILIKLHRGHFWALCLDAVVSRSSIINPNKLISSLFRGGGPGDHVNLDSVATTPLSTE